MDTFLVFPYFLAKFLARLGIGDAGSIVFAAILSTTCVVAIVVALFHRRTGVRVSLAGFAWGVIVLSVTGFVWECRAAEREVKPRHRTNAQAPFHLRELAHVAPRP